MSDASNGDWLEFIHLPSRSTGPAFSDVSCLDVYPKWRCPVFFAWVCYRFLLSSAGTFCELSNAKWHTRMSQELSKCFVTCLQDDIGEEFASIPCSCLYIYMLQVYVGYGISRSHSHTLPVARDSMKTPPPKKGSCILCLGYTQQLDRSNKLKPIS